MRCAVLGWLVLALTGLVSAQEKASWPTPAVALFQKERDEAAKLFSPNELKPAEELFARAEALAKAGNLLQADRLVRDARWQLPFKPSGLPEHVSRVIGLGRLRHAARVNALAYSPDGTWLASASKDGTVRLWDLGNGRQLLQYNGHADKKPAVEDRNPMWVPNVAFSPDGKTIASCGVKDIHVWDAKTGQTLTVLTGHGPGEIRGLAFGADANTVVSGGDDGRVIIWEVATKKPKHVFPSQPNRVESVAVSVKRNQIASVNAVGELHVFSLAGGTKAIMAIPITDGGQLGLGVAYAGEFGIVTCGGDNKAKLTAAPEAAGSSGTTVRSFLGHSDKLNCIDSTSDGSLIVTGSNDRTVRVWDVATGKNLFTFQGHSSSVTAISIRPDGKQAASASDDGTIRLWPLARADENRTSTEATEPLWTVAVSSNGKRVATGGADRSVRVYDAVSGQLLKTLTGHKGAVTAVQFLGTDKLASVSGDKLLKIWNLDNGQTTDLAGHASAVLAVTADEQGQVLVSGSVDRSIRGWNPTTGKPTWNWLAPSAVCALSITKDRKKLLAGLADGQLLLLNITGTEPKLLSSVSAHGNGVAAISLHPDSARLATCGGDGYARFWSITEKETLSQLGKLDPPNRGGASQNLPLTALQYSPDGKQIICAGAESLVRMVDAQTLNEVRSLRGHLDWVTSLALPTDGKTVYSVSVDKTLRAFDITPQDRVTTVGHSQAVKAVAVHPKGELLATASADGTVKVWNLLTGQEIATLTGSGSPFITVGFVGLDKVAAGGDDQRIRWWTWQPVREVRSQPLGGPVFSLATQANDGSVAGAWVRLKEKTAGFDLFGPTGESAISQVSDRGRELSCAVLSTDGTLAIAGSEDGVLRLWDLKKKDRLGADWPLFKNGVADVGITPDQKTLIAIDSEGLVKIADLEKRTAGDGINAVSGGVNGLIVSPTGDRFATLAADGLVKVWNLKGEALRSWKLTSPANGAAFTPDGKKLVTGQADGTALVLDLP